MSEDEGTIVTIQSRILDLLSELDETDLSSIEHWIGSSLYRQELKVKKSLQNTEKKIDKIVETLKKMVPLEAVMPSENINPPEVGDQANCNSVNMLHVDEYLYDEDDVEKLTEKGKLKRHYCLECKSRNIEKLIFISHSMSRQVIQYISRVLLPKDLEDKQILDVGSRLGAVLYSTYYHTNASRIIGIEMNKEFCELQEKIIDQYSLDKKRVKVVHADIMERSDLLISSDIIIMNVFDFFVDTQKHRDMWFFFKKHMSKGAYLVLNRSLHDTLGDLDIYEEFVNWLAICKPCQLENELYFNLEDCSDLFLYSVN